jgi:hypothetical protein
MNEVRNEDELSHHIFNLHVFILMVLNSDLL